MYNLCNHSSYFRYNLGHSADVEQSELYYHGIFSDGAVRMVAKRYHHFYVVAC